MNYSLTVSLGSGEKGKQWDTLIRQTAKKNKMSVGAFARHCFRIVLMKEADRVPQPAPVAPQVPQMPANDVGTPGAAQ